MAKLGQGIHFRGQNIHWSILTGVLVANHYIMGHLSTFFYMLYVDLYVIWHKELISEVKKKYSSILTGSLVAGSYIMGHLPTYLHALCRFIGYWAQETYLQSQI